MATANLRTMDIPTLLNLRKRVDETLADRRTDLQKQLEKLIDDEIPIRRRGMSNLKGRKVPPKYRSPSGETWAGRGAKPRWLVAAMTDGKKLEDFLIEKSAQGGRKKRRSKR